MKPETHELDLVRPSHLETALEKVKKINEKEKREKLNEALEKAAEKIQDSRSELLRTHLGINPRNLKQFSQEELAELTQKLAEKVKFLAYFQIAMGKVGKASLFAVPIIAGIFGFRHCSCPGLSQHIIGAVLLSILFGFGWLAISFPIRIELDKKFKSRDLYFSYQFLKRNADEKKIRDLITPI